MGDNYSGRGTDNRYVDRNSSSQMEAAEETWLQSFERKNAEANKKALEFLSQYAGKERAILDDLFKFSKKSIEDVNAFKNAQLEKYRDAGMSADEALNKANMDAIVKANELKRRGVLDQYNEEKKQREAAQKTNKSQLRKQKAQIKENTDLDKKAKKEATKEAKKTYRDNKKQQKKDAKQQKKDTREALKEEGASFKEIIASGTASTGQKLASTVATGAVKQVNKLLTSLKDLFNSTIETYGNYQAKINTRLQGSGKTWEGRGSDKGIEATIKDAIGVTPYVKLQSVMDNVVTATENGIAYNVEQRAFLQTVSENIASTFNAFDSNLLRLIRLQQADSTAARLGTEAALTDLYNSLYKDSSYLNDEYDTVSANLIEATSQMSDDAAVSFEYVVQKWLGSLYSVGASDSAISKISQALGYLGSGNVEALSGDSEMQSLLVMAASRANLNYSELLTEGLDASNTNKLLKSMVQYLAEIAESDNKVVKSQYANLFGMSVSDLTAVKNITGTIDTIASSMMGYEDAYAELNYQMGQLDSRLSLAGKLQNLYNNFNYNTATTIAGTPALYAMWEITSAVEDLTGGINLPSVSVVGSGVDLETTVTNLMRLGIVGAGTLGGIGSIITGLSTIGNASSMLDKLGITSNAKTNKLERGGGLNRKFKGVQKSGTLYVGNTSGGDYYDATLAAANDTADTAIETKKASSSDLSINDIHEYLLKVMDPKITDIERMLGVISGYDLKINRWGDFVSQDSGEENYSAQAVEIKQDKSFSGGDSQLKEIRDYLLGDFRDAVVLGNANLSAIKAWELKPVFSFIDPNTYLKNSLHPGVTKNDYVQNVFDPKITGIETILNAISTYISRGDAKATLLNNGVTQHVTTNVTVSAADTTQTDSDERTSLIKDLKSGVTDIYDLLTNVVAGNALRVTVDASSTGLVNDF